MGIRSRLSQILRNEEGSALQLALVTTVLLMFLATEIASESLTQYLIARKEMNRVRAYQAAEACMEINLLRLKLYQFAANSLGEQAPTEMLDLIWQIPFSWPPTVPDSTNNIKKGEIQKLVGESLMKQQWIGTIQPEGNKIDINDLGSVSEKIREKTKQSLLQIFTSKIENDEEFNDRWGNFNFEELVNNITDWVDSDSNSLNGGDERGYYRDLPDNEYLPPNQSFKTFDELLMVHGMEDEIFALLKERVTIFGVKGININYAEKDVLLGLSPEFTEDVVDELLERRSNPELGGPFKNLEAFQSFLDDMGIDGEEFLNGSIPLIFDPEFNFRLECVGTEDKVARKIVAIVYDFDKVKERLVSFLEKEEQDQSGDGSDPEEEDPCKEIEDEGEKATCICNNKTPEITDPAEKSQCVQEEKERIVNAKKESDAAEKEKQNKPKVKPGKPNIVRWYEDTL